MFQYKLDGVEFFLTDDRKARKKHVYEEDCVVNHIGAGLLRLLRLSKLLRC